MKSRKHRKKLRPNPLRIGRLSDNQLCEISKDLAIQQYFGMLGTGLALASPKIKEAMLNIIVSAQNAEPTALTESTEPQQERPAKPKANS